MLILCKKVHGVKIVFDGGLNFSEKLFQLASCAIWVKLPRGFSSILKAFGSSSSISSSSLTPLIFIPGNTEPECGDWLTGKLTPAPNTGLVMSKERGSGLSLVLLSRSVASWLLVLSLLWEWWVNTDLMFSLFIQSLNVLAGMLCFMLDLFMDCPFMISLRAAWRLSSLYCLYLLTGAEFNNPAFEFGEHFVVLLLGEIPWLKLGVKLEVNRSKGFCMLAKLLKYGFVHICIAWRIFCALFWVSFSACLLSFCIRLAWWVTKFIKFGTSAVEIFLLTSGDFSELCKSCDIIQKGLETPCNGPYMVLNNLDGVSSVTLISSSTLTDSGLFISSSSLSMLWLLFLVAVLVLSSLTIFGEIGEDFTQSSDSGLSLLMPHFCFGSLEFSSSKSVSSGSYNPRILKLFAASSRTGNCCWSTAISPIIEIVILEKPLLSNKLKFVF